jgi:peptide/nickel transport system substrate-binding protein
VTVGEASKHRRGRRRGWLASGLSGAAFLLVVAIAITGCGGSSSTTSGGTGSSASSGSGGASEGESNPASFYTGPTPGGTPKEGGSITVVQGEVTKTLDPVSLVQPDEVRIASQIFDQLFEYMPGKRIAQPALATSYTVSKDGLTYTFQIRPGVKFSNGEPLTAEDVVFSLERQKGPKASAGGLVSPVWKKISATGPLTVVLELSKPQPALIGDLGLAMFSIVPKKVVEAEGESFAQHPVGTGPFMFKSATPGYSSVTLERNPEYWRTGKPYLDEITFKQEPETNSRILAVRSGEANVATGISFSQVASLEQTPGVEMIVQPLQDAMPAFFNVAEKPFQDVKVRQALNYATPREEIIESVFKGMGEPSNAPTGHLQYWDPNVEPFPYDIEKAKKLIKESSVPNGFSTTINVPAGEPDSALVASILQSSWAEIGVHVTIQPLETGTLFSNWLSSKFQVVVLTDESFVTEQYPPDLSYVVNFDYPDSGSHSDGSNFNSPKANAIMRKAVVSTSEAERKRLFGELQKVLTLEEAANITIAELPSRTLVSDNLRGFDVLPTNGMRFEEVWLEK